jgi:hypothetical protein
MIGLRLSQPAAWVNFDRNNDGVFALSTDPNSKYVIDDIRFALCSKVGNIETLVATARSDDFGRYYSRIKKVGSYVSRDAQSAMIVDGIFDSWLVLGDNRRK